MSNSDAPVKPIDRSIWLWGFLYFVAYTPYAGLVKAMSAGKLPGLGGIEGLALLPTVLTGTLITLPVYVLIMGWWRYARIPPWPVVLSGFGTSLIIATTTLAYCFHGISVLFALLLLRGGMLIIAPITDLIGRRRVRWFSSVALVISLSAVLLGIVATDNHRLSLAAIVNLAIYLIGYQIRLPQMTKYAKVEEPSTTRTYFVSEIMVTLVFLALIPLTGAALGMATPRWFELTGVGMIMIALMFLSPLHHIPEWMYAAAVQRLPFGNIREGS